jgi:peptidoglycan/LPS O-acetylase OafA/YrhL
MITSFLFISKLINVKEKPFDWIYFFISRICRLAPMYYVSITIVALIVFQLSQWKLNVSPFELIREAFHWAAFTITTTPTINDFDKTTIINAGVIWSLPFEWLFYFSLPLIALLILNLKPKFIFLIVGLTFIILFTIAHGVKPQHILSFCGGAIAPFLMKFPKIIKMSKSIFGSIAILICLFVISLFQSADETVCKMAIIVLFTIVALGNSLFGILKNNTVKFLGEMAYSTYLLHGIVLFCVLYLGFGLEKVKQFSEFEYASLIFIITPLVVLLSHLGFKYIEKPFMNKSKKISQYFQPHK